MQGGVVGFLIAESLAEHEVFRCKHRLAACVVGVEAFPSARHCAAVEYDIDAVVVCVAEDVFIEAHGFLLVAAEEVDLYTFYSEVM